MKNYDDIIERMRPPSRRPPMSLRDRAAQFAPFAALTGHGAALAEVARLTDERKPLSDEERDALNRTMTTLCDRLEEHPTIRATYFVPDEHKAGGAYKTVEGAVRTIDDIEQRIVFIDGSAISIPEITALTIDPE